MQAQEPEGMDMDSQDIARELTDPGAQELLHSATLARLAYTGKDGFPRAIPIGFHWNGTAIVVCTAPISPKVAAISARPEVALTIDTGTMAAKALLIRGRAAIEEVDGIPEEYILASSKAMDPAQLREFEANVQAMYKQMSRISITPSWARYYDFGAGRVPGFLLKLASGS
jgi:nitroimidazol reductase NimA-like FMN-containing flavoprotein (pyridoxamine 5'-phosphate oxidase superfamily)